MTASPVLHVGDSDSVVDAYASRVTNRESLQDALTRKPDQFVLLSHPVSALRESEVLDLMQRFPSAWLVRVDGFSSDSLRDFLNTGKVRALIKPGDDVMDVIRSLEQTPPAMTAGAGAERVLMQANERLRAFTHAMIGIQRADSVSDIETALNGALNSTLDLAWIRVVFNHQSSLSAQPGDIVAEFAFALNQSQMHGRILFGRSGKRKFSSSEMQFLGEITDTASLALERLGQLDEAETLKQQWEATFDAIPHPLAITLEDNTIIRTNRAFSRVTGHPYREFLGKNVLTSFFPNEKSIAPTGSTGQLRLTKGEGLEKRDYDVFFQKLSHVMDGKITRLFLFRDVTAELRLERRILQSSKLAEVGTIASSIAHELNNPLGGMLSFLQLILMDLKKTDSIYGDVKSMEEATLRCRDIIQNLLGFTRLRGHQTLERIDLREAVDRSVKLIELQSRSKGIQVRVKDSGQPLWVEGQVNALSQALCNILQNSVDAISEKMANEPRFHGEIDIEVQPSEKAFRIGIRDNGPGIRPEHETQIFNPLFSTKASETNSGLGLTIAHSIIQDHRGQLEIISQPGSSTTVLVTLPSSFLERKV